MVPSLRLPKHCYRGRAKQVIGWVSAIVLLMGGAGTTLLFTQTSACTSFVFSPLNANFDFHANASTVNCSKSPNPTNGVYAGCAWVATSNVSWITLPGNTKSDGTGVGTVPFSVLANSGPARVGTISFSSGQYGAANYTINQGPSPLAIQSPTSLPSGSVGVAYGPVTFIASGGAGGGYTWSATGLPPALTISVNGSLSGTPAAGSQGSYSPTFTVKDANGGTASLAFGLIVNPPQLKLTGPSSLPQGAVGAAYPKQTFTATGGTGTYQFSATNLPSGLTFVGGVLSGTPVVGSDGNYNPVFSVSDSSNAIVHVTLPLTVIAATQSVTTITTSPDGLQIIVDGQTLIAPQTFNFTPGSLHSIGVITTQPAGAGSLYAFASWNDGLGASHNITGTAASTTYTATFKTQYQFSASVSPNAAGTITPASGYYDSGTSLQVTAAPATNFAFSNWSGDLSGSANPQSLAMTAPRKVTATFVNIGPPTLTITTLSIPAGLTGVAYSPTAFQVSGGKPPYQWSELGVLPGTMSLSSGGVLSGTPAGPGTFLFTVTVKDSSTPPLTTQSSSFALVVTQAGTLLSVAPQQLNFTYVQGDTNLPNPQNIAVLSSPGGTPVTVTSTTLTPTTIDEGDWLKPTVNLSSGKTPGTIVIAVDPVVAVNPGSVAPNTFSGQITISAPNATPPSVTVNVTLTVNAAQNPQLSVTPSSQSYALSLGDQDQGLVVVSNSGGGSLNYSAVANVTNADPTWLTLTGSSTGTVTPSTPSSIGFAVSAVSGLSQGLHRGQIAVTQTGSPFVQMVNVALLVNQSQKPIMQLSQTGLTFSAVQNSTATVPAQSISIFDPGTTSFLWTTQVQYLAPANPGAANQSWLTATPSGSSTPTTPGQATLSVNAAGLAKGQYYATVNLNSASAGNSPQSMSVLLNVAAAGELGSAPQVSTSGVMLSATAGTGATATQGVTLFNPAGGSLSFTTSVFTSDGGSWLSVSPASGTLGATGTAPLTIQANVATVTTGVHFGTVQVAFSEGTIRTIQVAFEASAPLGAGSSCTLQPTQLVGVFQNPGEGAQLQVGQAQSLAVKIAYNNCSALPLPSQFAYAFVTVNGANQQPLTYDSVNGIWTASWTPTSAQTGSVRLQAVAALAQNAGGISLPPTSAVDVTVLPANSDAAPQPSAILNAASFDLSIPTLVVPGEYVSIYGDRMADGTVIGTSPLQATLGGTKLLLGNQPLPLLFVTPGPPGQVNGLIPQNVPVGTTIQLIVERDSTASAPILAFVTDIQPGIYTTSQTGQGQGAIAINGTNLVAGPAGTLQQPVTRGQYIQIYATGLGAVSEPLGSPPPGDGQPAPASGSPLFHTNATATVTIGGVNAPVAFSGLTPGYVGLYQVNAQVPSNAPVGNAVPVVLTVTDSSNYSASSQKNVTIAVQ